ncbi:MAG: hypothetical protein CL908_04570 [Deltaproteobacteria bacterium]|nr:hypothetical protein [Deltaproteobacteria bacterium]
MTSTGIRQLVLVAATFWLIASGTGCATPARPDPLEPMNRGIFAFNEALDRYALEPVARGWDYVLPSEVQKGIDNFFLNLGMPIVFANDLLQLKPKAASYDLVRFLENTIFGLAGVIDIASRVGVPENDEDFGQTLGYWGVPSGPYLVVPILGPYTLRDGFGEVVDTTAAAYAYTNPFWMDVVGLNDAETAGASIGMKGLELLNLRAIYLEEIEGSHKDAFDYYVFVRNAYLQSRRAQVADQTDAPVVDDEDLYFLDEDEEGGDAGEGYEDEDYDYDEL